jgi:hypothetical protein
MATRNIVPRAAGEGSLGTEQKPWGGLHAEDIKSPAVRRRLAGDTTFYVRTDGDDGNDGLSDAAAGAFETIEGAFDAIASRYDIDGRKATISVGEGNFPYTFIDLPKLVGCPWGYRQGQTPYEYGLTIRGQGQDTAINGLRVQGPGALHVKNLQFKSDTGSFALMSTSGSFVNVLNTTLWLGPCGYGLSANQASLSISNSTVNILASSAVNLLDTFYCAYLRLTGSTVANASPLAASGAFVSATHNSVAMVYGNTFTGEVSGKRYKSDASLIHTNGGGENCLPGTVAGTTTNGGIYA